MDEEASCNRAESLLSSAHSYFNNRIKIIQDDCRGSNPTRHVGKSGGRMYEVGVDINEMLQHISHDNAKQVFARQVFRAGQGIYTATRP
jgi:hypothetical protein